MPPRWPRKPDRKDPDFRKLDDRMNFAVHVGICATVTSGLWFFHILKTTAWEWLPGVTVGWIGVLLLHLIYIGAIANYDQTPPKST
jgi:hypothetical protein